MTTLAGQLSDTARRRGATPFLTVAAANNGRSVLTYAAAAQRANGIAARLRDLGVRSGDCVAAAMVNGPDLALLPYAASSIGAVVALADPHLRVPELDQRLSAVRPRTVLTDGSLEEVEPLDAPPRRPPTDGRAPAVVVFTSGSTGGPRGCLLSSDSFIVPAREMADRLALTSEDVLLDALPLHHMAGLAFLVTGAEVGATVALLPRFSGSRFWADVRDAGATVFRHLGEMLAVLCHEGPHPAEAGHSLRLAYGGGASEAVARRFSDRFGVLTVEGYGLSETNTVLAGSTQRAVPGTLGEPLPHQRVRLVRTDGSIVPGVGEGELQVAGNPALMLGYVGMPDETAAAMRSGWFRTGDLVRRDADGSLRFVRRLNDVIRRRGENIDPAEIERAAEAYDGVRRAVAVGVPGRFGGVEIRLHAELGPESTLEPHDLRRHLAEVLAPFKQPQDIVFGTLPRTASEKIDRPRLRQPSGVAT